MHLGYPVFLVIMAGAWPVLAADRLTDRDVKDLVAQIEQGRDRFDDALDDTLKRSIVRGATGEVDVGRFLDDFQESIDRLEERLTPDYAASTEAETLLRQASAIDRFFRRQPAGTKGESEWNRLATDLDRLAAAYGADFPLADGAIVRRMGDREVAATADAIARDAERLKRLLDTELKKDATVDKSTREAIKREADLLSDDAETLRGRVRDGKPSSAEADRVMARAAQLHSSIASHQVPMSASAWSGINTRLQRLADAYGMTWRPRVEPP